MPNPFAPGIGDFAELALDRVKMLGSNPGLFAQTARQAYQNMGQGAIAPAQGLPMLEPGMRPGIAPEVQQEMMGGRHSPLIDALLRQRMQGQ